MRVTTDNKSSIEKIHLLSGENKQKIRTFFEALISVILLDYIEGESTNIPFLGTLSIKYKGEKIINGKKEADIQVELEPENNLIKNVGQVQDEEECDIEKMIKTRIREALRKYL